MSEELVHQLAKDLGGTVESMMRLPDGSGCATISMPLPADHWSTANPDEFSVPPMPFRLGTDSAQHHEIAEKIRAAGRYAYRSATMNGKDTDLDPDALIRNLIVGLIGYWTPDGLSSDEWANPSPVPPPVKISGQL